MTGGLLALTDSPLMGGEVGVDILCDGIDDTVEAATGTAVASDTASMFSLAISSSPTERLLRLEFPFCPLL